MITLPPEDLSPSLLEYIVKQQELITRQQRQIALLMEQNVQLQARIEVPEAEIIRLKKLNPKPNIKPGSLLFKDYSHGQGFFNSVHLPHTSKFLHFFRQLCLKSPFEGGCMHVSI